jgi:hypothetical protein
MPIRVGKNDNRYDDHVHEFVLLHWGVFLQSNPSKKKLLLSFLFSAPEESGLFPHKFLLRTCPNRNLL